MLDNECPKDNNEMNPECATLVSFKVASLVTGIGVGSFLEDVFGRSCYLLINLLPAVLGIAAVDRLYPLKPKNPI